MGYPEDLLAPNERLLLHRHQHWKVLIGASLWLIVIVVAAVFGFIWASGLEGVGGTVATGAVAIAAVALLGWLSLAPLVRWATTHFVITNRRILFRTGVITRTGIDIPIARIASIQFRHGIIDRIFRTGTLIIESASDDPLEFDDIPEVEQVHSMLYNELWDDPHDTRSDRRDSAAPEAHDDRGTDDRRDA
ncbi:PH domain-containing protein [Demequina sp. NBRC 110056]|uniref:PH domain-containing protein n=1 Tax=Demequina sp. NBRC 110056 TaxID=1570345 RepID=UPI000A04B3EB|nr:PH domain-containing protein [Demequina sp. NBRC 110056]